MALRVRCKHCSLVLYVGESPVSIGKLLKQYGGRCPRCLRPLSKIPIRITVAPKGARI